jgi:hypothetical protein
MHRCRLHWQASVLAEASPILVRALLAPAASAACVRQAVECLTALAPHMIDSEVLEQVAHACSDARSRRSGDVPEASWAALEGAIATQAVSVCVGGGVRCKLQRTA